MSRCKRKCIKYQSQEHPQDSFCKMRKAPVWATASGTYVIVCDFLIILEISVVLSKFVVLSTSVGLATFILVHKLVCFRAIILNKIFLFAIQNRFCSGTFLTLLTRVLRVVHHFTADTRVACCPSLHCGYRNGI